MRARRILLWTLLAVSGLLVAVGVTTAATSLTSQRVGLQAEPLDAGEALAPRDARDDGNRGRGRGGDDARTEPERSATPDDGSSGSGGDASRDDSSGSGGDASGDDSSGSGGDASGDDSSESGGDSSGSGDDDGGRGRGRGGDDD